MYRSSYWLQGAVHASDNKAPTNLPHPNPNADFHIPTVHPHQSSASKPSHRSHQTRLRGLGFLPGDKSQHCLGHAGRDSQRFHEEPKEAKAEFNTRDRSRKMRLNSNFNLYQSKAASWRDIFVFSMTPVTPQPYELPPSGRVYMCHFEKSYVKLDISVKHKVYMCHFPNKLTIYKFEICTFGSPYLTSCCINILPSYQI